MIHWEKGLIAVSWGWETAILPRCLGTDKLTGSYFQLEYEYLTVAQPQASFKLPAVSGCEAIMESASGLAERWLDIPTYWITSQVVYKCSRRVGSFESQPFFQNQTALL